MISVITPTIRPQGLELVERALDRQTLDDFEWLVGSPSNPKRGIWVKDDFKGGVWSLNRIYNKLISKASGDLLVSWQDYTFANPEALEKFWYWYQENPRGVVTGVGGKYKNDNFNRKVWKDPRERTDLGTFYECYPNDIEFNFCSIPRQAMYDIGGFDEKMDFLGFGMDGISVVHRLDELGYKFYIDQTNKSYSLIHDRPENWEEKNLIHGGYAKRKQELQ